MSRRPICFGFTPAAYKVCLQLRNSCVSRFLTSVPNRRFGACSKRALSIICSTLSYNSALASLYLELLLVFHNQRLCRSLFDNIWEDSDHRLHHLLPDSQSLPKGVDSNSNRWRGFSVWRNGPWGTLLVALPSMMSFGHKKAPSSGSFGIVPKGRSFNRFATSRRQV